MSVHPCNLCGEQAPSCTCPDGPHHADGKGDVTDRLRIRCEPTLAEFRAWLSARIDAAEQVAEQENAAALRASPSDFSGREQSAWEALETAKRLRHALGQVIAFQAGVR